MTHYQALGVAPTATPDDIRAAYLRLARRHHPDAGGTHERMREVNEAWAVLGNSRTRRAYDLTLGVVTIGDDPVDPGVAGDGERAGLAADLVDDTPLRPTPAGHGIVAVAPVALFVASVAVGIMAMMLTNRVLLGAAFAMFAVAGALMIAVPLVEMTRGSRVRRR